MSTPAQIAANQANSKRSTGPKTDAGKAASSRNNFKHGFCGKFHVTSVEDQSEFDALLAGFQQAHQPANFTEEALVQKMAEHYWLSRRAQMLQDSTMDPAIEAYHPGPVEQIFNLALRYQTTHERAFHKCLDQLTKLKAEGRKAEKAEIGFERQRQEAARQQQNEQRKQETHEIRLRIAKAAEAHKPSGTAPGKSGISADLAVPGESVVRASSKPDRLELRDEGCRDSSNQLGTLRIHQTETRPSSGCFAFKAA